MKGLILFDGLFSSSLAKTFSGYPAQVITRCWWQAGPKSWEVAGLNGLIVVGHSLGGAAALRWCSQYDGKIDLLITLDPRVSGRPYSKPSNVQKAVNFRRNSLWMHGYEVAGADNQIETCGHMQLVTLPGVRNLISVELSKG